MKKWLFTLLIVASLLILPLAGCGEEAVTTPTVAPEPNTLISVKTSKAPALDAKNLDSVWNSAPALNVELANGEHFPGGTTDVTLKSVYTNDEVYFMVQWTDPSESLDRTPWVKQADGNWKKTPAREKYEDKLAFIWNINDSIAGFNTQGCLVACHAGEAIPEGGDYGKKYTSAAGEVGDIWHWKSARTDSLDLSPEIDSFVDDQALDSTPYNPDVREGNAGRYSDPGDAGYRNNESEDETMPQYQWQTKPTDTRAQYFLLDDNLADLVDSEWVAGDQLPGVHLRNYTRDRGDILASSYWSNGKWTLVLKRKLDTGSSAQPPVDVQFSDLSKTYYFGVAAFENSQVRHAYVSNALMFKFSQ